MAPHESSDWNAGESIKMVSFAQLIDAVLKTPVCIECTQFIHSNSISVSTYSQVTIFFILPVLLERVLLKLGLAAEGS